jgi:hypothetical protein
MGASNKMEIKLKPEPKPFLSYGEWKGKQTITFGIDNGNPYSKMSFGKAKAKMIVANFKEIEAFANSE